MTVSHLEVLHCEIYLRLLSAAGHNPNCRPAGLRQLWPAADIRSDEAMSEKCQEQTHAPQQMACLIEQLVRDGKQRRRHSETQCLRSLEIDDELKSSGKLYR